MAIVEVYERLEHLRDPFFLGRWADEVGDREQAADRRLPHDPVARPLEQLDIVLGVAERDDPLAREPRRSARKARPAPSSPLCEKLEEDRQRLRDVQAAIEAGDQSRFSSSSTFGRPNGDELGRRPVEPGVGDRRRGDLRDAGTGVALRFGGHLAHVELVVDVDVQRMSRPPAPRRSPRGRARVESARAGGTRRSKGSTTAAPW